MVTLMEQGETIKSDARIIEGFEYPIKNSQNPQKSTLNLHKNKGYSKSSIPIFRRQMLHLYMQNIVVSSRKILA